MRNLHAIGSDLSPHRYLKGLKDMSAEFTVSFDTATTELERLRELLQTYNGLGLSNIKYWTYKPDDNGSLPTIEYEGP